VFTEVNGLPAHVLLVHLTIVLVPAAAALAVAEAWSVRLRRWAGPLGPLLCLGALVMVPITSSAGKWLRDHLRATTPLIRRHAQLGTQLLPWVIALFALSVAVWYVARRTATAQPGERPAVVVGAARVQLVLAVLVTVAALGTVAQLVRIGDSGAKAVWTGVLPS
jgi:hypothetical protein